MAWNGSLVMASPTGNYHPHQQQFSVNEDNGEVFLGSSPKRPFYSAFDAQEEIVEDISGDDLPSTPHAEKKRRLTSKQVSFLEQSFEAEIKLEPERKALIAKQLGLQPRQVAVWFQNRRARWKTKQLESDYIDLKADYDAILKENDNLQAEVKRLQAQLQKAKTAGSEESPPPFVLPVLSDESPCSELHPKVEDGELDDSVRKPPSLHIVGGVSEKIKEEEEEAAEELSSSSSPSKSDDSEVLESSAGFAAISVEPPTPLPRPLSPSLSLQPFTPGEEQLLANPYLYYNPYLFQHHLVMKLEGAGGGGGGIPSGGGAFFTDESSTSSSHVFFAWEENTALYPWYNEGCDIFAKPSSKEDDKCSYHI